MLQTARAFAFNLTQCERRIVVHVLMDSGSQCSYITHKAKLRLRSMGTKSVQL